MKLTDYYWAKTLSGGSTPSGTIDLSYTENGEYTANVAGYAEANITVNVSGGGGGGSVDENGMILDDWATVISLVESGQSNYEVGNYKPLDLGTEGIVNMQIVAFDADALASGSGNAATTWISKELMQTKHRMNPSLSPANPPYDEGTGTIGGWEKSEMRSYFKNTIKPLIPSTVRNAIKEVKKYSFTYKSDADGERNALTADDVWLPSEREMFGSAETSGPTYSSTLYTDDESRVKEILFNGTYYAESYFTRTGTSVAAYSRVNVTGTLGLDGASGERYIPLGFCI